MIDIETLGKRLREIRVFYGITQNEIAKELHVTQSAVSKVEKGGAIVSPILLKFLCYYSTRVNIDILLADEWELIGDDKKLFNKNIEINSVVAEKVQVLRQDFNTKIEEARKNIDQDLKKIIKLVTLK